ncbi:hypothetical protein ANTPLA_LOCUS4071 [Anthophora plagiata]
MDRHTIFMSPNSLRSSVHSNVTMHNNIGMVNTENQAMDLRKLSSRIICSDNITRQNLNNRPTTSVVALPIDDDEQFFKQIKSKIDKKLLLNSKENCKPNMNYESFNLIRKKRPIIDKETQNVIKRFKRDTKHTNPVQSLNNANIVQANPVNNALNETYTMLRNTNDENIMQHGNMFPSSILNTNFRVPPSKFIFQVTSKLQKNVLPFTTNEIPALREEYEESLFYEMFLTPPDSNSPEDNINS